MLHYLWTKLTELLAHIKKKFLSPPLFLAYRRCDNIMCTIEQNLINLTHLVRGLLFTIFISTLYWHRELILREWVQSRYPTKINYALTTIAPTIARTTHIRIAGKVKYYQLLMIGRGTNN